MKKHHILTIDILKKCVASNNAVTRSVYKDIAAKRMGCSADFIQIVYLIGYGT